MDIVTYALAKKYAKTYTDTIAEKLAGGLRYMGSKPYEKDLPAASEEIKGHLYTVLYKGESGEEPLGHEFVCDGTQWIDLSIDLVNKVDKPIEPVAGQGVNVPYYFNVNYAADNVTVKDYTVDLLDKNKAHQTFSLDVNPATSELAGVMKSSDAIAVRETLPARIDTEIADRINAVSEEANLRTEADNNLYSTLNGLISAEADLRRNADSELQININTEAQARQSADTVLQNNIDAEEGSRISGDNALSERINQEEITREQADNTLTTNLAAEVNNRISADSELAENLNQEQISRLNAEAVLQANINSEAELRTSEDARLQTEIDALSVEKLNILPNVSEGPGAGYPYWIPYDFAANATDEKVEFTIKALSLDNQLLKHEFTNDMPMASSVNAGMVKASDIVAIRTDLPAADAVLQNNINAKQDILTAGDNIQINNNVISATDTRYTVTVDL